MHYAIQGGIMPGELPESTRVTRSRRSSRVGGNAPGDRVWWSDVNP